MSCDEGLRSPVVDLPPRKTSDGSLARAMFLDRDGVINVNHGYVHKPEQTHWVTGIFELVGKAREMGFLPIVVTNQAGIARGYYSEKQFLAYTRWMHDAFSSRGAGLASTYYCPHHPQFGARRECSCRKPSPGMLLAASRDYGLDMARSIMVGDKPSDIYAAVHAGVGTAWLLDKYAVVVGLEAAPRRASGLEDILRWLQA